MSLHLGDAPAHISKPHVEPARLFGDADERLEIGSCNVGQTQTDGAGGDAAQLLGDTELVADLGDDAPATECLEDPVHGRSGNAQFARHGRCRLRTAALGEQEEHIERPIHRLQACQEAPPRGVSILRAVARIVGR